MSTLAGIGRLESERVRTRTTRQRIGSRSAVNDVVTRTTDKDVVAGAADHAVIEGNRVVGEQRAALAVRLRAGRRVLPDHRDGGTVRSVTERQRATGAGIVGDVLGGEAGAVSDITQVDGVAGRESAHATAESGRDVECQHT